MQHKALSKRKNIKTALFAIREQLWFSGEIFGFASESNHLKSRKIQQARLDTGLRSPQGQVRYAKRIQ
jgi:hypothetical protein